MKTKYIVYKQEICENCLQMLSNADSQHTEEELNEMNNTLTIWMAENYIPAGPSDINQGYFSWRNCDLCGCLPGNRYEYNFFDTNN